MLLIRLLLLCNFLLLAAESAHICTYDSFKTKEPELQLVQELPYPKSNTHYDYTAVTDDDWRPIRIRVTFRFFDEMHKYCVRKGVEIGEITGKRMPCTDKDLVKENHKRAIVRGVHSAIKMHAERLKVQPIKFGFKVPKFTTGLCSKYSIPPNHQNIGVMNADMVLYASPLFFFSSKEYAVGAPCAVLQRTKRPIVGVLAFNAKLITADEYNVRVIAHEMAHALGFDIDIISTYNTVEKRANVRSKPFVLEVKGHSVVEAAKNHYGCASLTGMEMEDEVKVNSNQIFGSIWEARHAKDELMSGLVRKGYYTNLTLALFHSLGYYKADFTKAEHMDWGYKMGCDFLTKPCIENGKSNFPRIFCTETKTFTLLCTADGQTFGTCHGLDVRNTESVPTHFKYFTDTKLAGYSTMLTDRCPYIEEREGEDCRNTQTLNVPGKRGPNSWCMAQNVDDTKYVSGLYKGTCAEKKMEGDDTHFILNNGGEKSMCSKESNLLTPQTVFPDSQLYCPSEDVMRIVRETEKESILLDYETASKIKETEIFDAIQFEDILPPKGLSDVNASNKGSHQMENERVQTKTEVIQTAHETQPKKVTEEGDTDKKDEKPIGIQLPHKDEMKKTHQQSDPINGEKISKETKITTVVTQQKENVDQLHKDVKESVTGAKHQEESTQKELKVNMSNHETMKTTDIANQNVKSDNSNAEEVHQAEKENILHKSSQEVKKETTKNGASLFHTNHTAKTETEITENTTEMRVETKPQDKGNGKQIVHQDNVDDHDKKNSEKIRRSADIKLEEKQIVKEFSDANAKQTDEIIPLNNNSKGYMEKSKKDLEIINSIMNTTESERHVNYSILTNTQIAKNGNSVIIPLKISIILTFLFTLF